MGEKPLRFGVETYDVFIKCVYNVCRSVNRLFPNALRSNVWATRGALMRTPRGRGENGNLSRKRRNWWAQGLEHRPRPSSHAYKRRVVRADAQGWLWAASMDNCIYCQNMETLGKQPLCWNPHRPTCTKGLIQSPEGSLQRPISIARASTGCEFQASVPWHLLNILNILPVCMTFPHLTPRVEKGWTHHLGTYRGKQCFTRSQRNETKVSENTSFYWTL